MEQLSEKAFWDRNWAEERREDYRAFPFDALMRRYLPSGGSYLEIGCAPGTTMAYFHHTFGYRVAGVDFSSIPLLEANLARDGVHDARLIEADFTQLTLDERFHVVASFGFVEHFSDTRAIIRRHAELVEPGGFLVVEVPNLRYFNHLLYWLFDRALLRIHNLDVMRPRALSEPLGDEFEILYCQYYKSCFLFFNADNAAVSKRPWLGRLFTGLKGLLERIGLADWPNPFFSPYLVLIARRREV